MPGLERPPGGGHGNPLQYSYLENPMTERPGRLQSTGSQTVRHDWIDWAYIYIYTHIYITCINICIYTYRETYLHALTQELERMARIPIPSSQKSFELWGTKYIVVTRAETGKPVLPTQQAEQKTEDSSAHTPALAGSGSRKENKSHY